jgi:hypothetical protein
MCQGVPGVLHETDESGKLLPHLPLEAWLHETWPRLHAPTWKGTTRVLEVDSAHGDGADWRHEAWMRDFAPHPSRGRTPEELCLQAT